MSLFPKGYKSGWALWQYMFGCRQCKLRGGWHKLDCSNNGFPIIKVFKK